MSNKKLIQQYVNTGMVLNQYQLDKLPNSLKSRYIDLQIRSFNNDTRYTPLFAHELFIFTEEQLNDFFKKDRRGEINDLYNKNLHDHKLLERLGKLIYPKIEEKYKYLKYQDIFRFFTYSVPMEDLFIDFFRNKPEKFNFSWYVGYILGYGKIKDTINKLKEYDLIDKLIKDSNFGLQLRNLDFKNPDTKLLLKEGKLFLKLLLSAKNPLKTAKEYIGLVDLKNELEYRENVLGHEINKGLAKASVDENEFLEVLKLLGYE